MPLSYLPSQNSTTNNGDDYPEPDYDNQKSIYITNWTGKKSDKVVYPSYGPPYFTYSYSGSFTMPETGFLARSLTDSSGINYQQVCGTNGCAQVGYDTFLHASHPGVFSTPDLYYMKKGAVVSVGSRCGEPAGEGVCNVSTLINDFYVVYYPPKKK